MESATVPTGDLGTAQATCPAGKKALGAGAYWLNTYNGLQLFPVNAGASKVSWTAGGTNTSGTADQIRLSLVCANASWRRRPDR